MLFMTLGLCFLGGGDVYIEYGNNVTITFFLFVVVTCFLLRRNYVVYLFDVVTFFDYVRIML